MDERNTSRDLTRYNRSGLARVAYVDANAATLLERLRNGLAERFPEWDAAQAQAHDDIVAEDRRVLAQYVDHAPGREDMLWQCTRTLARATHVLAGTLDAYANEGWLGTATQWESLRRLVAMLDYAPHPAASAYTPVGLLYKPGKSGTVPAGLQLRHLPVDGGAPIVFETLEPQHGDAALNELRVLGHDRNPQRFTGARIVLEGKLEKIRMGDAMVFEDERSGRTTAHLVQGVTVQDTRTIVVFEPPVTHAAPYTLGWLRVHAVPREKLAVRAPATHGATVGRALQMATTVDGLAPGDIVVVGRPGAKPVYRRLQRVDIERRRLVFHRPLGGVDLERTVIARPVAVPISRREAGRDTGSGARLRFLRVTGDWSRLQGLWLADLRVVRGQEYLPMYECVRAEYTPMIDGGDAREGYTILGLAWGAREDGVAVGAEEPPLGLDNPQSLLAPPPAPGPWRPDPFLQQSDAGALVESIVVETPKHTRAGDHVVLVRGARLACARMRSVAVDEAAAQARLSATDGWRGNAQHGATPFFLSTTRLHGHFDLVARAEGWSINNTPLAGETWLELETQPPALHRGASLLASTPNRAMRTVVAELHTDPPHVVLRDPLPGGTTVGNLRLHGNVVAAGHGETRPVRILGSGDATRTHQSFVFDATQVSFVPDPTMPAGVRADVQVQVGDERWTQVANLNDSTPTDAHYQVRIREDGLLTFGFGDAVHGRRLPTGLNNLRVSWRQGVDIAGNLPPRALRELVHPHALVAGVVQPVAAAGGGARESAASLRDNAAASILAMERAVSLEDFARLLRSHAAVAQARAMAPPTGYGRQDRVEVSVVPAGGAELTVELARQLDEYLALHAASGVVATVRAYEPVTFGLEVAVRVRRDAFDPDLVIARVRAALRDAFGIDRRGLGQPLYRGELLAVVDKVPGVENSSGFIALSPAMEGLAHRVVKTSDGVVLAVVPKATQCIHLPLRNPVLTVKVEDYTL